MGYNNLFVWKENFPPVYGHTSIAFLKHCSGFTRAKNGDIEAALTVVRICAKKHVIVEIKQKYPDAVLLPIITNNKLPEALAMVIGLRVHNTIFLCKTLNRKSLTAMERLLHLPTFIGNVIEGEAYIIVDDVVTQGGTISALRRYVISNGGFVIAITALAYSINSQNIAPNSQDISGLMVKFNYGLLSCILKDYNIAEDPGELTKSQIKYLLKFKSLCHITAGLERASHALDQKVMMYSNPMSDINKILSVPQFKASL